MKIYIDADACPKAIKQILYKAAKRTKIVTIFVANRGLELPRSPFIQFVQVGQGFDMADKLIADRILSDDIVVTADIPLANEVIDKGAIVIHPKGTIYDKDNIKQKLTLRNFNEMLRGAGEITSGPSAMNQRDIQNFANALDHCLRKLSQ